MLVLGIDPGTATTGFGVVKKNDEGLAVVSWGLIETDKNGSPEGRLQKIHKQMLELIARYQPDVLAIEKLFFATNAKTAMRVGQAQGVMLLAASQYKVPVAEYSPVSIKKWVAGNGRADKKEIQKRVRACLGAKVRSAKGKKTHFDNAADGLAVALCHIMSQTQSKGGE